MKALCLLPVVFGLAGCASYPFGKDEMCREIATFANSIPPGTEHSVSLETAWGPSKLHPNALASRDCDDGNYQAGAKLCHFLMQDSAAEFSENNFRRAFACLRRLPQRTGNYVSYDRLNVKVSAFDAYGVKAHVEVTVEFMPNDIHGTEELTVGAKAYPQTKE